MHQYLISRVQRSAWISNPIMKNGMIVTIDGPSAAGKSSVAKLLAGKLGFLYLDSGALYRAIGWKVMEEGLGTDDINGIQGICEKINIDFKRSGNEFRITVDQQDITEKIREPKVSKAASEISALPIVRKSLLKLQKELGKKGDVVIEGRDIGTVVFPEADIKFYIDADIRIRGERRWKELRSRGIDVDLEATIKEIEERDRKDLTREIAPLAASPDAMYIDTTKMSLAEVADSMFDEINNRIKYP